MLLLNLLDNAIEGCQRVPGEKVLQCSLLHSVGLYISVSITSLPVKIENGRIPTSKDDPYAHGYGMASICHILDRPGAEYTFEYADGWFRFAAEIKEQEVQQ